MTTSIESAVSNAQCYERASDLVAWFNSSCSNFHAVAEAKRRLIAAGYLEISERTAWDLKLQGKYFFSRNASAIVAFAIGGQYSPGNGAYMIGAHTDSPCLKLKPISKKSSVGTSKIAVQTYGGGLWTTWFDRDLGVAGRVLVRGDDGTTQHALVRIDRPICRIPMLAIHLARGSGTKLEINTENHLSAVLCSTAEMTLNNSNKRQSADSQNAEKNDQTHANTSHDSGLVQAIAKELNVPAESVIDFELQLIDIQPATIGGLYNEYIFSGRIDNLSSCYTSLAALIESTSDAENLAQESGIRLIVHFDHEEVGSNSAPGAQGPLVADTLKRIANSFVHPNGHTYEQLLQKSFMVSADCAHAVHPNYVGKHESSHQPLINGGIVIKHNANQRYATTSIGSYIYRECAKISGTPTQDFVVRQDMGCGSTIGPITAGNIGVNTIDIGMPQWSMHSARETMGSKDPEYCVRQFRAFFDNAARLVNSLDVDITPEKQQKL